MADKENETEFYRLYSRLLPKEVGGTIEHEHNHLHSAVSEVDTRIGEMLTSGKGGHNTAAVSH